MRDYGGEHRILVSREETMDKLAVQVEITRPRGSTTLRRSRPA